MEKNTRKAGLYKNSFSLSYVLLFGLDAKSAPPGKVGNTLRFGFNTVYFVIGNCP